MKKILLTLLVILCNIFSSFSQCDIKTTNRPDNNTIKYFNPIPVIRQSDYEVGVAIYKNITTDVLMINVSVLFKELEPTKFNGNLIIQTTNTNGIELKPLVSELMKMNGRDVAIGMYEIEINDKTELENFDLKSVFFHLNSRRIGSSVTENENILKNELNCFTENEIILSDKFLRDSNNEIRKDFYGNPIMKRKSNTTVKNVDNPKVNRRVSKNSSDESEFENRRAALVILMLFGVVLLFIYQVFIKKKPSHNTSINNIKTKGYYKGFKEGINESGDKYKLHFILMLNEHNMVFLDILEKDINLSQKEEFELVNRFKTVKEIELDFESKSKIKLIENQFEFKVYNNVDYQMSELITDESGDEYFTKIGVDELNDSHYYLIKGKFENDAVNFALIQSYFDYSLKEYVVETKLTSIILVFKKVHVE